MEERVAGKGVCYKRPYGNRATAIPLAHAIEITARARAGYHDVEQEYSDLEVEDLWRLRDDVTREIEDRVAKVPEIPAWAPEFMVKQTIGVIQNIDRVRRKRKAAAHAESKKMRKRPRC